MTRNFVWTTYPRDGLDDTRYLKDLAQRIGPLPGRFREAYAFEDVEDEELDEEDLAYGDMRFAARRDGPLDMMDEDLEDFVDLMSRMLRWEPGERPTTKAILDHAFFKRRQL
ncbi:cyclin-dependent kinase 1 [Elsinoe australis]|uniref:Cyclin-dependent kinase 1 n=1 Tax=Elsinoe australis TaxID=40998 RepID=A0A2P7Z7K6_9PEZI|nr:cyclin-dependent kinase 1 [Elsinoe australis]